MVAGLLALMAIGRCATKTTDFYPTNQEATSTRYVTARSLNCRADAKANANVVRALAQGEAVKIVEESGRWSKVDDARPCWASSDYLSTTAPTTLGLVGGQPQFPNVTEGSALAKGENLSGSGVELTATSKGAAAHPAARSLSIKSRGSRSAKARRARRSSNSVYGGGVCPCSGRRVCIGPRGGRYCITSGGNKRYGV